MGMVRPRVVVQLGEKVFCHQEKKKTIYEHTTQRPRAVLFSDTSPTITNIYGNERGNKRKAKDNPDVQHLKRQTKTVINKDLPFPNLSKNWYKILGEKKEFNTSKFILVRAKVASAWD